MAVTVSSGGLPTGATINANGFVTYTYGGTGTYNWGLLGTDASGNLANLSDSVTINSEILSTWAFDYTGSTQNLFCIGVANGDILACGWNNSISYSTDKGATFTFISPNPLGSGPAPTNCIYFNGNWYIFTSTLAATAPGSTFAFTSMANAPVNTQLSAAILTSATYPTGALYLGAYGTTNSTILRMNTPGAAWTAINTGFAYGAVVAICQAGTEYFVVCASGKILKSSDLVTFTLSYDTLDVNVAQCAYLQSGSVLVVTNTGGDVYRSPDLGVTWTKYAAQGVEYVTATRQEFLGARTYNVLKSTDGITWTIVYTNTNEQQSTNFATDGSVAAIGCLNGHVEVGTL